MTAQELMTIRDSDWRRTYLLQHPLAITISLVLTVTGVLLLVSPPLFQASIVAQALPSGLEYPWDLSLVCGGGTMLLGFWRLNTSVEAAGEIWLSTAIFVWLLVYVSGSGDVSVGAAALALAVAAGLLARAIVILTASESSPWMRRTSR